MTFSENVTPQQFSKYVEGFTDLDESWLIIEWQPIVSGTDRQSFEQNVRRQMYPDFQLWEPGVDNLPVPAEQRKEHTPVLFMVSKEQTANTIGLDLAWSDQRMRSKWRARDLGQAQLSPFFDIVLSAVPVTKPIGFAMTVPIYQQGLTPQTTALRQQEISGYIAGVFSLKNLLKPILDSELMTGLHIQVSNSDKGSEIFNSNHAEFKRFKNKNQSTQKLVNVFGQQWIFSLAATDTFESQRMNSYWELLPFVVIFAGGLLVTFVRVLSQNHLRLIATQMELKDVLVQVKKSEQYFADLSRHDPLTGLMNRRAFLECLEAELIRAKRYEVRLALLIVDVDKFKPVNDEYGHPAGDQVLIVLAQQFQELSRESDFVCRFGGEEFAFLLINTSEQEGLDFSRRLCHRISEKPIVIESHSRELTITVSIGMTIYHEGDNASAMLSRADSALYQSEEGGRNQVQVS